MRPQRFSCGIHVRRQSAGPRFKCFNEAAAFQLRNRHEQEDYAQGLGGFNEAAAFQLRNRQDYQTFALTFFASMRPQRFSCGINGYTDLIGGQQPASMRPQRFSCGIHASGHELLPSFQSLQ